MERGWVPLLSVNNQKRERQRANRESSRVEAAREQHAAQNRRRVIYGGLVLVIVVILVAVFALSSDDDPDTATTATDTPDSDTSDTATDAADTAADTSSDSATDTVASPGATECPAEDGSSSRTIDFASPQPMCIDPSQSHVAVFDTSEGEIRVTLDTENTPLTVNNFVTLARWGYYDNTTIFRTDPGIDIIQGGSPHTESPSDPGPGYTIVDEPTFDVDAASGQLTGPYRYEPGQLVMARSGGPDAAGAQFFFTTGTNAALLDGQGVYVVFGDTDGGGLDVLQQIIGLHVAGGSLGGAPSRDVTINSVTIEIS